MIGFFIWYILGGIHGIEANFLGRSIFPISSQRNALCSPLEMRRELRANKLAVLGVLYSRFLTGLAA